LAKKTAQAKSISKIPKYIGFLVILYIPPTTKEEAAPGFIGLNVVLARRNEIAPRIITTAPQKTMNPVTRVLAGNKKVKCGVAADTSRMNTALIKARTTGGIFNSRNRRVNS
jgi:hypothetical protein